MAARLTEKEIKARCLSFGFELLAPFTRRKDRHLVRCLKCDYVHNKTIIEILNANQCVKCAKRLKLTIDYVKEYCEIKGINVLSDTYINARTKLNFQCIVCSYEWATGFASIHGKWQTGCPKCAGVLKYTLEYVQEYCASMNIKLLSTEYNNKDGKLDFECMDCANQWSTSFGSVHNTGTRCPACSMKRAGFGAYSEKTLAKYSHQWANDKNSGFYVVSYECPVLEKKIFKYGVGGKARLGQHVFRGAEIEIQIKCAKDEAVAIENLVKRMTTRALEVTKDIYPFYGGYTEVYVPSGDSFGYTTRDGVTHAIPI